MKKIVLLGSTGSIGRQALEVIKRFDDIFQVLGLACYGSNLDLFIEQIKIFKPQFVCVYNTEKIDFLQRNIPDKKIKIFAHDTGLRKLAQLECDLVIVAIVGIKALLPTLEAIAAGNNIALANKEVLVTAGRILLNKARKNKVQILPIDSEHSAIYQCINGEEKKAINRIILTASGGPLIDYSPEELKKVTQKEVLNHPVWKMGKKITVDSATLMNKGFEILETKYLFNIPLDKIEVVIHRQAIIHSMVEFKDGVIKAIISQPDMRLPIQYALFYPKRVKNDTLKRVSLKDLTLSFSEPDYDKFPCLKYAIEAAKVDGSLPVVVNAADEVAVELFLDNKINLVDIPQVIKFAMNHHHLLRAPKLKDILNIDREVKDLIRRVYKKI